MKRRNFLTSIGLGAVVFLTPLKLLGEKKKLECKIKDKIVSDDPYSIMAHLERWNKMSEEQRKRIVDWYNRHCHYTEPKPVRPPSPPLKMNFHESELKGGFYTCSHEINHKGKWIPAGTPFKIG